MRFGNEKKVDWVEQVAIGIAVLVFVLYYTLLMAGAHNSQQDQIDYLYEHLQLDKPTQEDKQ